MTSWKQILTNLGDIPFVISKHQEEGWTFVSHAACNTHDRVFSLLFRKEVEK